MIEPRLRDPDRRPTATPIHVARLAGRGPTEGRVVVLHGVQSHGGWYHSLGRTLADAGYEAHFPDRRGSGANEVDRGHAPSAGRLLADIAELLRVAPRRATRRRRSPWRDQLGRQARGDHGRRGIPSWSTPWP